jgi:hypothetical protein
VILSYDFERKLSTKLISFHFGRNSYQVRSSIVRRFIFSFLLALFHFFLETKNVEAIVPGPHRVIIFGKSLAGARKFRFLDKWAQRGVELSEQRLSRRGDKFHMLRQRLNEGSRVGLKTLVTMNSDVWVEINKMSRIHAWWDSRYELDLRNYFQTVSGGDLLGVSVYSHDDSLAALALAYRIKDVAKVVTCVNVLKGPSRWVATEGLIQELSLLGVSFVHLDGLVGLNLAGFEFQQRLGARTLNLKLVR